MSIQGKTWKYGDDVNTDVLYPGHYTYQLLDDAQIASHALEDLDPAFAEQMEPGDILVGGWNWGVGSARQQAVKSIKLKGTAAIIAKSFARIYFRNCLNEGLLAIACPAAVEAIEFGDIVQIDMAASQIHTPKGTFFFEPYPEYMQKLVEAGGIIPYTAAKLRARKNGGNNK